MEIVEYQKSKHQEGTREVWEKSKNDRDQVWEKVLCEVENNQTYVAMDNNKIVGFITIRGQDGYIMEWFTSPKDEGYGSKLIKEVQNKRACLCLHVKITNKDAIEKYEHWDFVKIGFNREGTKHFMKWVNKGTHK